MTVKQVQHLLGYLGFYLGTVDGLAGPETGTAVRRFQRAFGSLKEDGIAGEETQKALRSCVAEGWVWTEAGEGFWKEIRHFKREEFRCPCSRCGGFPAEPEEKLVRLAEGLREYFGVPILVSSGVRCRGHNGELQGSVPNSRHLTGKAMDFCVKSVPGVRVLDRVREMKGVRYAYAIDGNFVHMDID